MQIAGWHAFSLHLVVMSCLYGFSNQFRVDLFYYDLAKAEAVKLTENGNHHVCSPRFSPDGKYLVYLEAETLGPHNPMRTLKTLDWTSASKSTRTVVDLVKRPSVGKFFNNLARDRICKISGGDNFPGLFLDALHLHCWSSNSKWIFCTTQWGAKLEIAQINVDSGEVRKLTNVDEMKGSWRLLDHAEGLLLAAFDSPAQPHQLV